MSADTTLIVNRQPTPSARAAGAQVWGTTVQHFVAPERKRLRAEVDTFRARIEPLTQATNPWSAVAIRLLNQAQDEQERGDLDKGWRYLHAAKREEVHGFDPETLLASIRSVGHECKSKLSDWRLGATQDLFASLDENSSLERKRSVLLEAMAHRDAQSDNVYFRNRLLRRQIGMVSLALLGLGATFLYLQNIDVPHGDPLSRFDLRALMSAMALGGMGACFSALTTFASSSSTAKIPEHLANVVVTFARPLIGAVSGLVAALLVQSDVVQAGKLALVLPFAFGFSERLVVGALSKVGQ